MLSSPVWAQDSLPEKTPLTLEILQEKVKNPVTQDGFCFIDLQNFIIDLQPENAEFSQEFYQEIKNTLNQSENTVGLNLSNSIIKEDFTGSRNGNFKIR